MAETAVLDASALLALLQDEPGADAVAAVLGRAVIGAVNLAEVATKVAREGAPSNLLRESVVALEIEVMPYGAALAYTTGDLAAAVRRHGLSLGDRACLALARHLDAPALTTDRAWMALDIGVEVKLIR
ncbi:MAG TPA: type II toxin-antitoxin system VapC family toxin [Geminicoccaceae bacterium]